MHDTLLLFLPTAGAYLLGSIPFGLLLASAAGLGDIRKIGSGNIGATNVLRAGNKPIALLTLLLDGAKGFVALYLTIYAANHWAGGGLEGAAYAAVCAQVAAVCVLLGHMYPVWLQWKGGKGVATFFGIVIAVNIKIAVICAVVWLALFATLRYSSLASLVAVVTFGIALCVKAGTLVPFAVIVPALIIFKHRDNIRRLLRGEEHRFSFK